MLFYFCMSYFVECLEVCFLVIIIVPREAGKDAYHFLYGLCSGGFGKYYFSEIMSLKRIGSDYMSKQELISLIKVLIMIIFVLLYLLIQK